MSNSVPHPQNRVNVSSEWVFLWLSVLIEVPSKPGVHPELQVTTVGELRQDKVTDRLSVPDLMMIQEWDS